MAKTKCSHKGKGRRQVTSPTEVQVICACGDVVHRRDRVESSNIYAVGRAGKTTEVQFKNRDGGPGSTYIYLDVPDHVHLEFMEADSHGEYFSEFIKDRYDYKKTSD